MAEGVGQACPGKVTNDERPDPGRLDGPHRITFGQPPSGRCRRGSRPDEDKPLTTGARPVGPVGSETDPFEQAPGRLVLPPALCDDPASDIGLGEHGYDPRDSFGPQSQAMADRAEPVAGLDSPSPCRWIPTVPIRAGSSRRQTPQKQSFPSALPMMSVSASRSPNGRARKWIASMAGSSVMARSASASDRSRGRRRSRSVLMGGRLWRCRSIT
jgi:hypothetical protein